MKKIFILALAVCSLSVVAQKKKPSAKPASKVPSKTIVAKHDNMLSEVVEKNNAFVFYTLVGKDTLFSKSLAKDGGIPSEVKISPVSAGGTKLHSISWNQKRKVGDPKIKLENITESHVEIWDAAAKNRVFENTNSVNNITEIIWLDPNKTASKTVEKIRREGMECIVSPQGDVTLKNKSSESKFAYDAAQKKFIPRK